MMLLFSTYNMYIKQYDRKIHGLFDIKDLFQGEEAVMIRNLELLHITLMFLTVICFVEAYMVYAHIINTLKKRSFESNFERSVTLLKRK